ncbi:MAG: Gfo/Idh/MocA family oxidoreductase [Paludibacter sp.]
MKRRLKMGMVGGCLSSFIGIVHRMAAGLDNEIELVCGAFNADVKLSKEAGEAYYLDDNRVYGSYAEMFEKEKQFPEGERMDFVSIVTPNFLHFDIAKMALENGFHVVCEKPMTVTSEEAEQLVELVESTGLVFAITHPYSAYPLVKQAKHIVETGQLGPIRKVVVEYPQGWLATALETAGNQQASWRTNPSKSGKSGSIGDIGVHAQNLAEYISGQKISEVCADFSTFVTGRMLEDDANVLIHFDNGAKGILYASQISVGEENNLKIRVYGEKGGIEWHQQEPNSLILNLLNKPMQILRTGDNTNLCQQAIKNTRLPGGHPEGLIEAFANIYRNFAKTVRASNAGFILDNQDFASVHDGLRGMQFIDAVVESASSNEKWIKLKS